MKSKAPFKMTPQRQVILEELAGVKSHPTADAVYELVRARLPNISLATVYRNLDQMSEAGMILKLESIDAQKRFDYDTGEHYHVRCIQCGKVADLPGQPQVDLASLPAEAEGFEIVGYRLHFEGICPACRRAGADPEG